MTRNNNTTLAHISENQQLAAIRARHAKICAEKANAERQIQDLQQAEYLREQTAVDDDAADAALRLIEGDGAVNTRSTAEQVNALNAKIQVLDRGAGTLRRQIEEITDKLTADANKALQPAYNKAMSDLLSGFGVLQHCYKKLDGVSETLSQHGFALRQDLLPAPVVNLRPLLNEQWYDSGISAFKRQIKALGVIQ